MLKDNRDVLERCAKSLLQKETLDEQALKELTKDLRKERKGEIKAERETAQV